MKAEGLRPLVVHIITIDNMEASPEIFNLFQLRGGSI